MMVRALSFTHLWIAGAAAVTTWASARLGGLSDVSSVWAVWVGVSTGLGYTVQRAIKHGLDSESLPPMRRAFWQKWGRAMCVIWAGVWAAITAWQWEPLGLLNRIPLLMALGTLGLLYAVVPGTRKGLRASPLLKIPLIATAWALATTPLLHADHAWLFASTWLLIAGLTLPFDVRDLDIDANRISTLPMGWGVNRSMRIAAGLLVASSFCLLMTQAWALDGSLGWLRLAQGPLAASLVLSPWLQNILVRGPEIQRERWTGLVLDGVLWLPCLSALHGLG